MPPKRSRNPQPKVANEPKRSDFLSLKVKTILAFMRQNRLQSSAAAQRTMPAPMQRPVVVQSKVQADGSKQYSKDVEAGMYYAIPPFIDPITDVQIEVYGGSSYIKRHHLGPTLVSQPIYTRVGSTKKIENVVQQTIDYRSMLPQPVYQQPIGPQTFLRTTVPEEAHPYALAMLKGLARE